MALLGFEAVGYRDTANNYGSPTWEAVDNIRDNTLNGDVDDHDGTTRGSGKFKEHLAGHIDAGVDMSFRAKPRGVPDPHLEAFVDSWLNGTAMPMLFLDDLISQSGAQGLRAYMQVFNLTRSEPIAGPIEYTVTLKPSANNDGHPPEWHEVP